jgi:hypothetical protein
MLEGFLFLTPHVPSLIYYGIVLSVRLLLHQYATVLKAFTRFAPLCTGWPRSSFRCRYG